MSVAFIILVVYNGLTQIYHPVMFPFLTVCQSISSKVDPGTPFTAAFDLSSSVLICVSLDIQPLGSTVLFPVGLPHLFIFLRSG